MGIKIVTDSSTEISQKEAAELGIEVVPLKCIIDDVEYLDGIDLSPEDFYVKLAASRELPKTSQVSPAEFEQVFHKVQGDGDHQIIVITIAEQLSGTNQNARLAGENFGGNVMVIDSAISTIGVQLLVRRALQLVNLGKAAEEIVSMLEEEKKSLRVFAIIDTLEYLSKGGRLSKTSAFTGTVLNIKPIISIMDGEIKVINRCRGMANAYSKIFSFVESEGGIDYSRPFATAYTGNRDRFDAFEKVCEQQFGGNKPSISSVGSVIGAHVGPGAVAVAFFKK